MIPMDPELIQNLLVREFSSFHDRGIYYNKKDDPLSANLLALEDAEWREKRMKLTPIFTSGKMKMMFEIVNSIGEKFVSAIDKELNMSSDLEMKEFLSKFTTDVMEILLLVLNAIVWKIQIMNLGNLITKSLTEHLMKF